jgi:anthranilate synthase component I
VVKDGYAYVQAGAGVVADSDPEYEYNETVNKSAAMVRAIERAKRL